MLRVPDAEPTAEGVNVVLIVQKAPPAGIVPTQLSVSAKSVLEELIWEMVKGAVPSLITVTVWGVLRTLRVWLPKFTVAGTIAMPGSLAGAILATKALPATPLRLD